MAISRSGKSFCPSSASISASNPDVSKPSFCAQELPNSCSNSSTRSSSRASISHHSGSSSRAFKPIPPPRSSSPLTTSASYVRSPTLVGNTITSPNRTNEDIQAHASSNFRSKMLGKVVPQKLGNVSDASIDTFSSPKRFHSASIISTRKSKNPSGTSMALSIASKNQNVVGHGPVLRQSLASQASLSRKSHTDMNSSYNTTGNTSSSFLNEPKGNLQDQLRTLIGGSALYENKVKNTSPSSQNFSSSAMPSSTTSNSLLDAFDNTEVTTIARRRRKSMGIESLATNIGVQHTMPTVLESTKDGQSAFERLGLSRSGTNTPGLSTASSQSSKLNV